MKRTLVLASFAVGLVATGILSAAEGDKATFTLVANPQFAACLANPLSLYPPAAHVTVTRGKLNDTLTITTENIKPNLAFDLFTVQSSPFLKDGAANPAFTNFGLAWYQSDIQVNAEGRSATTIQTILLDQIFGFDPNHALPPTNTFHLGFWFNNPQDAAACNFNVAKPTPFNGDHQAGPMAMISLPTATNLGPLCINPKIVGGVAVGCNP